MTTTTRPETAYHRAIRAAREHFAREVTDHQMTVFMDRLESGDMQPYRHIRFARPGTGIWSFNLVTWPGHLSISGDLASFTFARVHDMFDFFRGHEINPSYWGEKVIAGARGTDLGKTRFSEEKFVEEVTRATDWARDDYSEADFDALKSTVQADLLDCPPGFIEEARDRLDDFSWSPVSDQAAALYTVSDSEFRFSDTWDWDLSGYDHHFLLACHAIQWGIRTYLAEFPDRLIHEVPVRMRPRVGSGSGSG